MPALPNFTPEGVLPPGDYELSLDELEESMLVLGPGQPKDHPVWDAAWRQTLVRNLRVMVGQLRRVGVGEIFIDGSFVEDKDHPNDIDGYFVCDAFRFATGALEHDLNRIDPTKCWTWDHRARRPHRGYPKLQLPMWHAYRVELYPHYSGLTAGVDAHGHPLEFPAWFRQRRTDGTPKGIVKLAQ
jgi:hypothetical protein